MRIVVTSVFVEDQEKALSFYTEVLGFQKKTDIPLGEDRWLTVVSPEERMESNCYWNRAATLPSNRSSRHLSRTAFRSRVSAL